MKGRDGEVGPDRGRGGEGVRVSVSEPVLLSATGPGI